MKLYANFLASGLHVVLNKSNSFVRSQVQASKPLDPGPNFMSHIYDSKGNLEQLILFCPTIANIPVAIKAKFP